VGAQSYSVSAEPGSLPLGKAPFPKSVDHKPASSHGLDSIISRVHEVTGSVQLRKCPPFFPQTPSLLLTSFDVPHDRLAGRSDVLLLFFVFTPCSLTPRETAQTWSQRLQGDLTPSSYVCLLRSLLHL